MQNPWKLPKPSYKYTNTAILITAHTQKTATVNTTNIKRNIFWSITGGWYKELKIITFCVFDWIQLLLFNGLFQNNYFTKHILQKTSLKNTCLRYLFCHLVDWALSFCASDDDEKVTKNNHSLQPWTKHRRSYLQYIFKRWKNESSNKVCVKAKLIKSHWI